MQTSRLFNLEILSVRKKELFDFFEQFLTTGATKSTKTLKVFTPNPEQFVLARHDKIFAKALKEGDYLLPDGIGLVAATNLLNFFGKVDTKIPERIAGVELVEHLLILAKKQNLKSLIIGGRDYAAHLNDNVFWTEAYQNKKHIHPVEEELLEKLIKKLQPDLVFVALGAPYQEEWIIEHQDLLARNQVKIAVAVGGSFDFIFDKVSRAPLFMQKMGLEWLWRLIKQPWRKHRQLRLIEFIYLVIKEIF
jgi:N-acetylglucosaminyldiphosphoundecaprenol N-acetyl-beta-D-mannosaminyltransferase